MTNKAKLDAALYKLSPRKQIELKIHLAMAIFEKKHGYSAKSYPDEFIQEVFSKATPEQIAKIKACFQGEKDDD